MSKLDTKEKKNLEIYLSNKKLINEFKISNLSKFSLIISKRLILNL